MPESGYCQCFSYEMYYSLVTRCHTCEDFFVCVWYKINADRMCLDKRLCCLEITEI